MATLPDFATYDDDTLEAARLAVLTEQDARRIKRETPAQADAIAAAYLTADARPTGTEWVQPVGAFDAYPTGWQVTHNGTVWESTTAANVWEPGVSSWREVTAQGSAPAAWVQPTGAQDAYASGDRVTFEGQVYESVIDANVWSPTAYPAGWEAVA